MGRSEGKNRLPPCADVFSFANVNKRASAGCVRRRRRNSIRCVEGERGGLVCWRETTPRVYAQPPYSRCAEEYDVNKEGGELLSAYVRHSSKGRRGVERWQHWQRRKWLLFSSGRLSVACRSDVWDRGERGRVEEKRDGWGTHRQPPSYGFRKINTPSFSSG